MASQTAALTALVRSAPALSGLDPAAIRIVELPASTNRNFKVETPLGSFALRLPREDPAGYVEAGSELAAARIASDFGFGAQIVHTDPASGAVLTRWIEGAQPLRRQNVDEDPALLGQVAQLLRALHGSGARFPRRFDAFRIMAGYDALRKASGRMGPLWSDRVTSRLAEVRARLLSSPLRGAPSHCDPVPANILDDGNRLWLIDWEYAGMNDPAWDLGYFALESGMARDRIASFLDAYGDPAVQPWRVRAMQLAAACLGALWHDLRASGARAAGEAQWAAERVAFAEALAADRGTLV